ncbi:MAG: hypothetical protein QOJ65_845 [Fimbriimonadaceae bacterium]|nr:hypothetical protein [Fimbriimonadaceae bacterium]
MSTASSERRTRVLAIVLFLVALAIRLVGITWGLPNDLRNSSLHPDEPVLYSNYAYMPNPLLPGNYNYPTLYPVMLRVAGDVAATLSGVQAPPQRAPTSLQDQMSMLTQMAPHMRVVNLAGRVLSALAGAGTAVVVFFLVLRFAGTVAALFAGSLTAIAPALVVHSRFQTVDVTATFFFWLAILFAVKLYAEPEKAVRDALLAGVFAGLSAGTKYAGALALLSVCAALLLARNPSWPKLAAVSLAACAVVFVITTPGVLFETSKFLFGVSEESRHMKQGQELTFVSTPPGYIYQLGNLFTGIGPLAFLMGIAGLSYGALKKKPWILIILPSILAYYLLIGPSQVKFVRYALPLIPAIAIGFGYAVGGAARRPALRRFAVAGGIIALLGIDSLAMAGYKPGPSTDSFDPRFGGAFGAYRLTSYMVREDPRDEAARYLKEKAQSTPGMTVGLFQIPWFWTVPVIKDPVFIYGLPPEALGPFLVQYLATTSHPKVVMGPVPTYMALTSYEILPFTRIKDASEVPIGEHEQFHTMLRVLGYVRDRAVLEKSFGDDAPAVEDLMYVQPRVDVLRFK